MRAAASRPQTSRQQPPTTIRTADRIKRRIEDYSLQPEYQKYSPIFSACSTALLQQSEITAAKIFQLTNSMRERWVAAGVKVEDACEPRKYIDDALQALFEALTEIEALNEKTRLEKTLAESAARDQTRRYDELANELAALRAQSSTRNSALSRLATTTNVAPNSSSINPNEIDQRIAALRESGTTARDSQRENPFQKALEVACLNHKLPVSRVILTLIANAPNLIKLYNRSKHDNKTLNQMIEDICSIIQYCLENNLADQLHHLFTLKNTTVLNDILKSLTAQKINILIQKHTESSTHLATVSSNVSDSSGANTPDESIVLRDSSAAAPAQSSSIGRMRSSDSLNKEITAFSSTCQELFNLLPHAKSETGKINDKFLNQVVEFAKDVDHIDNEITATISIQSCTEWMNLLDVVSQQIELLEVENTKLANDISDASKHQKTDHEKIRELNTKLQHNDRQLDQLEEQQKTILENLKQALTVLNANYQKDKEQRFIAIGQQLQRSLNTLKTNYRTWNEQYKGTYEALAQNLEGISALNRAQRKAASANLNQANEAAQAAEKCKQDILENIDQTLETVKEVTRELGLMQLPQFNAARETENSNISLEFLVKLANKFTHNSSSYHSAIELIRLLPTDIFAQLHNQLLQHKNIALLLKLQKFLKANNIVVTAEELSALWNKVSDDPNFDLLLPLKTKLQLNDQELIDIIKYFSKTWFTSFPILLEMFLEGDLNEKRETFKELMKGTKGDDRLLEKVYRIYQAIPTDDIKRDFFSARRMRVLIAFINETKERFVDEVIFRLEYIPRVPLTDKENYLYLLKRTKQFVDCDLSYIGILPHYADQVDNGLQDPFDFMCASAVETLRYTNPDLPISKDDDLLAFPELDDEEDKEKIQLLSTRLELAKWDNVCMRENATPRPLNYEKLERIRSKQVVQSLTEKERFFLELWNRRSSPNTILVRHPQIVLSVTTNNSNNFQAMPAPLFAEIEGLGQKLDALEKLIGEARELATKHGIKFELTLGNLETKMDGKKYEGDNDEFRRLHSQIESAYAELMQFATASMQSAFSNNSGVAAAALHSSAYQHTAPHRLIGQPSKNTNGERTVVADSVAAFSN